MIPSKFYSLLNSLFLQKSPLQKICLSVPSKSTQFFWNLWLPPQYTPIFSCLLIIKFLTEYSYSVLLLHFLTHKWTHCHWSPSSPTTCLNLFIQREPVETSLFSQFTSSGAALGTVNDPFFKKWLPLWLPWVALLWFLLSIQSLLCQLCVLFCSLTGCLSLVLSFHSSHLFPMHFIRILTAMALNRSIAQLALCVISTA